MYTYTPIYQILRVINMLSSGIGERAYSIWDWILETECLVFNSLTVTLQKSLYLSAPQGPHP